LLKHKKDLISIRSSKVLIQRFNFSVSINFYFKEFLMIKNLSIQKTAFAASMALALISAQAQTADGTVVITGQVSANTCKLNISDASGVAPTNNGVRGISLGTISPASASGVAAGGALGTKQTINFTLTNSTGSGTCTFLSGSYLRR